MAPLHRAPRVPAAALACAVLLAATGCSPLVREPAPEREGDLGAVLEREFPICGFEMLKASTNGICQNGLELSGLVSNGLGVEGLSHPSFATWFERDPAGNNVLMRYLVKCAAPETNVVTWTSPSSGIAYGWIGGLGLAPAWAGGHAMSKTEQQLLSGCLAAHVNKYGVSVPLSVLGRTASGAPVSLDPGELETFSKKEGCFFGNLFAGEPVMVGLDQAEEYGADVSSPRACALTSQERGTTSAACPPMIYADRCEAICTKTSGNPYYDTCTWGGKQYHAITTRLRASEIYTCGDGVCQFTESCGTGTTASSCKADCGLCPGTPTGDPPPPAPPAPEATPPPEPPPPESPPSESPPPESPPSESPPPESPPTESPPPEPDPTDPPLTDPNPTDP